MLVVKFKDYVYEGNNDWRDYQNSNKQIYSISIY